MGKGTGGGGMKGGGAVSGGLPNANQKVITKLLSRGGISGNGITRLISAIGGIRNAKSNSIVSLSLKTRAEKLFHGLSKSEIQTKSKNLNSVRIRIESSKSGQSYGKGGTPDATIISGSADVEAARKAGATHIRVNAEVIGPRGKVSKWSGIVKI